MVDLAQLDVAQSAVPLIEGLTQTRAIRRYKDEAIPEEVLRDIMFVATRAPSGSNRQPFRFIVLRDSAKALEAKAILGRSAREMWAAMTVRDGFDSGSAKVADSPKARLAATMQHYVDEFESAPVLVLPCLNRYKEPTPTEGASIYPAVQNMLLAARAYGYGGVITMFQRDVEPELRECLGIPDETALCATVTLGRPVGGHGPVRRRPLAEFVFEDTWGHSADWAIDPPGTDFTQAGPPKKAN